MFIKSAYVLVGPWALNPPYGYTTDYALCPFTFGLLTKIAIFGQQGTVLIEQSNQIFQYLQLNSVASFPADDTSQATAATNNNKQKTTSQTVTGKAATNKKGRSKKRRLSPIPRKARKRSKDRKMILKPSKLGMCLVAIFDKEDVVCPMISDFQMSGHHL